MDNEAVGLKVRKLLLESEGFNVLTATSGKEALNVIAANPIRAVILEYLMPGMDAAEVVFELRRLKPEVKILMLTCLPDLPKEVSSLVDACIYKGSLPSEFLSALQQLLAS